jgi:hypothetical protein
MRVSVLLLLAACAPGDEPFGDRPADYAPPPGAQGMTIHGPTAVREGATERWIVRSPDLAVGVAATLAWGTEIGPGRCPYPRQLGGSLCMDVTNPTRALAFATTEVDPDGGAMAVFDVVVPSTTLDEVCLQGFALDGADSATSDVTCVHLCDTDCTGVEMALPVDRDIWTTSVYSYTGAGGGRDDEELRIGGWGDLYYALLRMGIDEGPSVASSATLELYHGRTQGSTPTGALVDRIDSSWDWTSYSTGSDYDRLWWVDRPATSAYIGGAIPAVPVDAWLKVDITSLYNDWKSGAVPNEGVQIRPSASWNNWMFFWSSDHPDPALRPRLVVTP